MWWMQLAVSFLGYEVPSARRAHVFKTFKKDDESALVVVKTSADGSVCIF